jgi:ABC-type multidrug transport system fused ATPase/permease subunit
MSVLGVIHIPFVDPSQSNFVGLGVILFSIATTLGLIVAFLKSFNAGASENFQRASGAWKERYEAEEARGDQLERQVKELTAGISARDALLQDQQTRHNLERSSLLDTIAQNVKALDLAKLKGP